MTALPTRPPAGKLRDMQTFMAGILVAEHSTPEGVVSALAFEPLFGVNPAYLGTLVERVYAVTPLEIQSAARRYLGRSSAVIVVVGDRKAIESQLGAVGPIVALEPGSSSP